jgi:hypothetical protein
MIKLDTRGVEIPILSGAAKTLKQTNATVVEAYNFAFGGPAVPFWDLCRYMLEAGFRPWMFSIFFTARLTAPFGNSICYLFEPNSLCFETPAFSSLSAINHKEVAPTRMLKEVTLNSSRS